MIGAPSAADLRAAGDVMRACADEAGARLVAQQLVRVHGPTQALSAATHAARSLKVEQRPFYALVLAKLEGAAALMGRP